MALAAVLAGCWWDSGKGPLKIISEPSDVTVSAGATATFSVEIKGKAPQFQWRRNGVAIGGATSASYTTPATVAADNGALFSVVVSRGGKSLTSRDARLTVNVPPVITGQPANATAAVGATATFTVTASGTAPLSYQWRRNGSNITGATSASYTTPAVAAGDDGAAFSVVVSNVAGSATSATATLTVVVPPTIATQPADITVSAGASATFTVVASGAAPLSYQWRRDGADIADATQASYTTPALALEDSGDRFSVVVSNAAGSVTSADAILTVTDAGPPAERRFFGGYSTGTPMQLWVTDGTPTGTSFVTNWTPPDGSSDSISITNSGKVFAPLGDYVYFPAVPPGQVQGSTLWRSNGTAAGTTAVTTELGYVKAPILPCGNQLFFWGRTPIANELGLYVSDGTATGTRKVGTVTRTEHMEMACHEGVAYFAGRSADNSLGEEPWRSDGTDAGTFVLKDLRVGTGSSRPAGFTSLNGRLYFSAEVTLFRVLVVSNGTEAGTVPASGATPVPGLDNIVAAGNAVYFPGGNGSAMGLYRAGTDDVVAEVSGVITPRHVTGLGDTVFFFAEATSSLDFEPFVVAAGVASSLGTINPDGSADPRNDPDSRGFAVAGNKVVFAATQTATLDEPWVTDGTPTGTQLLKELVTGDMGSSPRGFVPLGNRVLFKAAANAAGQRSWEAFWATDGTAAGTVMLTPDGFTVVYY